MVIVKHFYDKATGTLSYAVHNKSEKGCIIIDPVWDIDIASGKLSTDSFDKICTYLDSNNLIPEMILETHVHADHLTSSKLFQKKYPKLQVGISDKIEKVQSIFTPIFNLNETSSDGSKYFNKLLKDYEEFSVAGLKIKILPTPGHTPACISILIDDKHIFTGDAIFMPDSGTGRCDFPAGNAKDLYNSIVKSIYTLPDETILYVGHDYGANGREYLYETTVGEQKKSNIHIKADTELNEFVEMRETRDKKLNAPKLLLPSLQVNIRAGLLPPAEANGTSYLKIPLKNS